LHFREEVLDDLDGSNGPVAFVSGWIAGVIYVCIIGGFYAIAHIVEKIKAGLQAIKETLQLYYELLFPDDDAEA
jgi:hypothetical protein